MKIIDIDSKGLCVMVAFETNQEFDDFVKGKCLSVRLEKAEAIEEKESARSSQGKREYDKIDNPISVEKVKKTIDDTGYSLLKFSELSGCSYEMVRNWARNGIHKYGTKEKWEKALEIVRSKAISPEQMESKRRKKERKRERGLRVVVPPEEILKVILQYSVTKEQVAEIMGLSKNAVTYWLRKGATMERFIELKSRLKERGRIETEAGIK